MVAEMAGNLARRAAPSAVMSVVFITTAAWAWRANTGAAGGGDEAVRELGEGQPLGASDLQELTAQRRVVDGEVDDGGDIASGDEANGVAAGAGGGVQHRHQHHVLGAGGGGRLDQGPVAVAVDGLGAGPAGSGEPVHETTVVQPRTAAATVAGSRTSPVRVSTVPSSCAARAGRG